MSHHSNFIPAFSFSLEEIHLLCKKIALGEPHPSDGELFKTNDDLCRFIGGDKRLLEPFLTLFEEIPLNLNQKEYNVYTHWVLAVLHWRLEIGK